MTTMSLPAVADVVLRSLAAHRLLTAKQIHDLHMPHATDRWTRHVLAGLLDHQLVDRVRAGHGARRVYFLTDAGHHALHFGTTIRWHSARPTATALHAHTLAVNDVGLAFVNAARARDDEFGSLAWQHEIAHSIGPPARGQRTELVIPDAVLTYLQRTDDDALAFHYRFLELDRATEPTAALAAKLSRYARLFTYTTKNHKEPQWHQKYPVFPEVLVVLTGAPHAALRRRAQTVLALCAADRLLQRTPEVGISIVLLEDLIEHGPWAPIFQRLGQHGTVTWTGETH
jgi:protein involved in plasmid replication-relaxation